MKHNFDEKELDRLYERTAEVAEKFEAGNEKRFLGLGYVKDILFHFDHEGMPKVDGTSRYMAENYSSVSTMVPGLVRVDTIEEAHEFLDLVENHEGPIDYEKVLKCAGAVHEQAWRDRIYSFVEDADELPAECDGAPYWYETVPDGAWMTTTVGESTVYGAHCDIVQPEDQDALLIAIVSDTGGEAEVELEYALHEIDGLEEFLVKQLLCVYHGCAYIRIDLMGAIWLDAVPENAEFLEEVISGEDFLRFYDEEEYRHGEGWVDARKEAVDAWCEAAGLPEYNTDEWDC